jgi:FtsH ternary system domain X3-analog
VAELLIILKRDPETGKQNIVVKLDSDPDSLPIEHEQLHKRLVEKLVGKGLKPEDLGEVIITREGDAQPVQPTSQPTEGHREKAAQSGK